MISGALVTIVIPFFNAEKYLSQAVQNVKGQSYENFEAIFVNDGSTDDGCNLLLETIKDDSRFKLISQNNQSAGAARNRGIDESKGKYITFWDVDDIINNKYIENMVCQLETGNSDIVICDCEGQDDETGIIHDHLVRLIDEKYRPVKVKFSWKDIPQYIFQLSNCWVWDKVYRTDFIKDNNIRFQNIRVLNDALFCCKAAVTATSMSLCDEILVTHRTAVKGSLETTSSKYWKCAYEMLFAVKHVLCDMGIYKEIEQSYINLAAGVIAYYIAGNREIQCFREAYDDYRNNKKNEFRFSSYSDEYYYNDYVRSLLSSYEQDDCLSFLFKRVNNAEINTRREQLYVKSLEREKEELEREKEERDRIICMKKWTINELSFGQYAKVIVYGYGDMGRDYCRQIRDRRDCDLVAVIDRNMDVTTNDNIRLISLNQIPKYGYDFIIIAIYDRETAMKVRLELIEKGVSAEQIIWVDHSIKVKA